MLFSLLAAASGLLLFCLLYFLRHKVKERVLEPRTSGTRSVQISGFAALLNTSTGTSLVPSLTSLDALQDSYNFTLLLHVQTLARVHFTVIQIHTEQRLWPPEGVKAAKGLVPFLSGEIYLAQ